MEFRFEPIGTVRSCFPDKFGIPRQSGLVPEARARVEVRTELADALDGLEKSTHVWVLFVFHESLEENPLRRVSVRPPRLGGAKRLGVFATRSPHRPNPIGLSACKVEKVDRDARPPYIELSGVDILDGAPVLDIKPYVAYADSIESAECEWAPEPVHESLNVEFSPQVTESLLRLEQRHPGTRELIRHLIALDPRPAHQSENDKTRYAMRVVDVDVVWHLTGNTAIVHEIRDFHEE